MKHLLFFSFLLACIPTLRAQSAFVGSRGQLIESDYIEWGILGGTSASVANPTAFNTNSGMPVSVSQASNLMRRETQGVSFFGNFAPGAQLLNTAGYNGPISISFQSSVAGAGCQIQCAPNLAPFTAQVTTFDLEGNVLGVWSAAGNSTNANNNSAIFIGARDSQNRIKRIQFNVTFISGGIGYNTFAINRVTIQRSNVLRNGASMSNPRSGHTSTLLPNGKVLVAGGLGNSAYLASAELYDPTTGNWTATGSLVTARKGHTATLLANGKVLVAGGNLNETSLASAELYDPATGVWTATGFLTNSRDAPSTTLLTNGKVLAVGGFNGTNLLNSAELYDPTTGNWSATGSLSDPRRSHTATLLTNGKVFVAGGERAAGSFSTCEVYDPVNQTWSATDPMTNARSLHTATLLTNGRVLVVGGWKGGKSDPYLASAQIYDPATGSWAATAALATARDRHTAMLLPSGKLLVSGGEGNSISSLASEELYDPSTGAWSATALFVAGRSLHASTLLHNGTVLFTGGNTDGVNLSSSELYDSAIGTWSATGLLATARSGHTATLLPNGKVLVAGGYNGNSFSDLASAELYDPATGIWTATGSLATGRENHTATLLPNGKVLVCGGYNSFYGAFGSLASGELYDPATGIWTATGSLADPRRWHTATLLPDGKVLVVGGYRYAYIYDNVSASAELFDPATGAWSLTGFLITARINHTATLLSSGKVLVAGGANSSSTLSSGELYDPTAGTWSATGSLAARSNHTATLLSNGKVLVAGGANGSSNLSSGQLYDPASGSWSATSSLSGPRGFHTATLLPNGKVLVSGGSGNSSFLASAELYDSAIGTWAATGSVAAARSSHTATLLPNGKVLVAGGSGGSSLASAELYDVGLGFTGASRSVIGSASFNASGKLVLTGTGFLGISSASGGNGSQDSPTNYPVLQLRRLDNEQCTFLPYDPLANVSDGSLRSLPVFPFSGYALATVFTNGIPSISALVSTIPTTPDIALEAPTGTPMTNGNGALAYGSIAPSQTQYLNFTIRNTGSADLTTITASIVGSDSGQFLLVYMPPSTLAPGTSAPFTIRFSPSSIGSKSATLSIASNDPDENPFTVSLTGTGVIPPEAWRYQYFQTTANSGNASDSADPDHDGLVNLLERAFNLNPIQPALAILIPGTGTTGLPLVRTTQGPGGSFLTIQFIRRKASANSGLTYTPQFSTALDGGGWSAATGTETVEPIDSEWERVTVTDTIDVIISPPGSRFGRVKVTASQ